MPLLVVGTGVVDVVVAVVDVVVDVVDVVVDVVVAVVVVAVSCPCPHPWDQQGIDHGLVVVCNTRICMADVHAHLWAS